ncbi:hypothetical protein RQP46_005126 [Phenoliferia psychrophenolica]
MTPHRALLHPDVLSLIFHEVSAAQLAFDDLTPTLFHCTLVCLAWNEQAESLLYRHVYLETPKAVEGYLATRLKSLTLSYPDDILPPISRTTSIRLSHMGLLILHPSEAIATFSLFLPIAASLQTLSILIEREYEEEPYTSDHYSLLLQILETATSLQSLSLMDMSSPWWDNNLFLATLLKIPPGLKILDLKFQHLVPTYIRNLDKALEADRFESLERLEIRSWAPLGSVERMNG